MLGFIIRRVLAVLPVMAMVAVIVFAILRLTPGDPAAIIAGDSATAEQLDEIRRVMGLDQPIYTQFFHLGRAIVNGGSRRVAVVGDRGLRHDHAAYGALVGIVLEHHHVVGIDRSASRNFGGLASR